MTKTWLSEQLLIFAGITTEVPDIPKTVDISLGKSFDILVQIQKMSPSQFLLCNSLYYEAINNGKRRM
ncbi:Erythromycin esterase [Bacillus thuringiensis serovar andalousiensis BGSC 4AW1]|nr:Erythromycin esterase [Bacillus thuringiensis serovar andalousiensis BGSC 4AW1]